MTKSKIENEIRRRVGHWAKTRGRYVFALWAVIGVLGGLLLYVLSKNKAGLWFKDEATEKLKEFADPWLIGVLFGAAIFIVGLMSLYFRAHKSAWRDGIAEEFSEAASSFGAITLVLCVWDAALGLPTSWPSFWLALVVILAAALIGGAEEEVSVVDLAPMESLDEEAEPPADYGVIFTDPAPGTKVGQRTAVNGTCLKNAPAGMELWLVRRFESSKGEIYPLTKLTPQRSGQSGIYNWWVPNAWVGGESGVRDKRIFEVWLVGQNSLRVFENFGDWEAHINDQRQYLTDALKNVPEDIRPQVNLRSQPLRYLPDDVSILATHLVERD